MICFFPDKDSSFAQFGTVKVTETEFVFYFSIVVDIGCGNMKSKCAKNNKCSQTKIN